MHSKSNLRAAILLLAFLSPFFARAETTGSIHGHVNDPLGNPMVAVHVVLSLNGLITVYSFDTDLKGNYKGSDIKPNTYVVMLSTSATTMLDRVLHVKIAGGADVVQNFDLSRPEYLATLPASEIAAITKLKQDREDAEHNNEWRVPKLNIDLETAREENRQKKYEQAEALMREDIEKKPNAAPLHLELGIALAGQKKYDDAIAQLEQAIALNAAARKPHPDIDSVARSHLGAAFDAIHNVPGACAAFEAAAKALPSSAAQNYTDEAIVLSRTEQKDATVAAADKAIAADPTQALPYYVKGQALLSRARVDPNTNRIVLPREAIQAYQAYLSLAPSGPRAEEVRQILAENGEKNLTDYSAGKRH